MNIQPPTNINQAVRPDVRAYGTTPVRAEPKAVAPAQAQTTPPIASVEELNSAVSAINKVMQLSNRNLEFSLDNDTNRTVVKMVDTSTGEMIRQYPSESVLAISRSIDQFQQGLLLTLKV